MPSSLTRTAGLKLGPVAFETLLKHYFDRVKRERAGDTQLRQDELLYDEAFNIAKRFFDLSTRHPIEELQAFSNARAPSLPWVHIVRVTVPLSCCDEAATLLIQALGGEEHASLLVGGTKWWQVRGIPGIAAEWVTARKDWKEAKKRREAFQKKRAGNSDFAQDSLDAMPSSVSDPGNTYDEGADNMRCILFSHGGGYYFGSIEQERSCIQRLARKIKGRVFAVNYRLAPQYPFPCALQDMITAYMYLIKPPSDAPHQPVNPSHIVVAGDSAGGGLTLALLQVLRDTGQPLPAGGVLMSPWCDLTHSFPSINTNTATDVIPLYGLSLYKPSPLWPPPSEEMTCETHTGLRRKIRQIANVSITAEAAATARAQPAPDCSKPDLSVKVAKSVSIDTPVDVGATTSSSTVDGMGNQTVFLETEGGEHLKIDSQIQLYTQNSLLAHPLVSPALSYLGGLPPLFFMAGDKEVLRDEIIYSAHKAADPSRFPLKDEARTLYPPLVGIEERYGPTKVHLQVYDDVAHDLPIMFPFTTPGKYCFRAIATFTKHVTGMLHPTKISPSSSELTNSTSINSLGGSPANENLIVGSPIRRVSSPLPSDPVGKPAPDDSRDVAPDGPALVPHESSNSRPSFCRPAFFSFQMKSAQPLMSRSASDWSLGRGESGPSRPQDGQNAGSSGKLRQSASMADNASQACNAGEASVYYNEEGLLSWQEGMIRERVSTQGRIRALEPADELDALRVPPALVGVHSESIVRRYLEGKALFDKKYAKELSAIERERNRNIDLAKKDITKNLAHLQGLALQKSGGREPLERKKGTSRALRDGLESSTGAWGWAWADERPPPSSIVSRRDTEESRRLARIADRSILQDEVQMGSNSLWAAIANFLATTTSSPRAKERPVSDTEVAETPRERAAAVVVVKKSKSVFTSLRIREKPQKS